MHKNTIIIIKNELNKNYLPSKVFNKDLNSLMNTFVKTMISFISCIMNHLNNINESIPKDILTKLSQFNIFDMANI